MRYAHAQIAPIALGPNDDGEPVVLPPIAPVALPPFAPVALPPIAEFVQVPEEPPRFIKAESMAQPQD